jgi:photosystem II stability/assembly factor-like uncharacterized protein
MIAFARLTSQIVFCIEPPPSRSEFPQPNKREFTGRGIKSFTHAYSPLRQKGINVKRPLIRPLAIQVNRILSIFLLTFILPASARSAPVSEMKMLTLQTGWAVTGGYRSGSRLSWTTDGGAHWRDITPIPFANAESTPEGERIDGQPEALASIFFLDTQKGWVLLCCGERAPDKPPNGVPEFHLAATTDAGRTWSIARVKIPHGIRPKMDSYSGQIEFADPTHGWMMLIQSFSQPADARGGGQELVVSSVLLTTSDGGTRWRRSPTEPPGEGGLFYPVSPDEGWQFTGPAWWNENDRYGTRLWVTRDGGRTWQDVSVPLPKELLGAAKGGPPPTPYYCDLAFDRQNRRHEFLAVIYRSRSSAGSTLVLFESYDGGRSSWKPIRTLNDLPNGRKVIVDVADSVLIAATEYEKDETVTLWRDGPDGKFKTDISNYFSKWRRSWSAVEQLSFVSAKQGWMRGSAINLGSTTDGGATWKELEPQPHVEAIGSGRGAYQTRFPIATMQLLTTDVGWALSLYNNLLSTRDGGKTWSEITPSTELFGSHRIVSAFFLNDKQGWALAFDAVFSTADAGAHWSMTALPQVKPPESGPGRRLVLRGLTRRQVQEKLLKQDRQFAASHSQWIGQISFSDPLNGWLNLARDKVQQDDKRWLLSTSDGGRTWREAPTDPGYGGPLRAISSQECWMLPYGQSDALSVTRDGGKTWDNVVPPAPKGVEPEGTRTYDLPIFKDREHGFLSVTYCAAAPKATSSAVLFATDDGGRTWKTDRMLTNLDKIGSCHVSSTMVGNSWIIAKIDHLNPTLTVIAAGSTFASPSDAQSGYYGSDELSFVSLSRGWINNGRVIATSDGGATWSVINAPKPPPPPYLLRKGGTVQRPGKPCLVELNPRTDAHGIPVIRDFNSSFANCTR